MRSRKRQRERSREREGRETDRRTSRQTERQTYREKANNGWNCNSEVNIKRNELFRRTKTKKDHLWKGEHKKSIQITS